MYAAGYGIKQMRANRAGGGLHATKRLLVALSAATLVMLGAVVAHGGTTQTHTTVVVQPGDTLWSIAAARYPADDVRVRVDDIEQANGLSGPIIEVGQTLRLPA